MDAKGDNLNLEESTMLTCLMAKIGKDIFICTLLPIFAKILDFGENWRHRLRAQTPAACTHGGCNRPLVSIHVQTVWGGYDVHRIRQLRRAHTQCLELPVETQHFRT